MSSGLVASRTGDGGGALTGGASSAPQLNMVKANNRTKTGKEGEQYNGTSTECDECNLYSQTGRWPTVEE